MVRVKDKGNLYVHQDANWNVIGLTDMGGNLVERYGYKPYGEMTVYQETGFGDYDGDGDVDSTDRAAGEVGGACRGSDPEGACRGLDLDYALDSALPVLLAGREATAGIARCAVSRVHNNVDDTDLTLFDSLPQGLSREGAPSFRPEHICGTI